MESIALAILPGETEDVSDNDSNEDEVFVWTLTGGSSSLASQWNDELSQTYIESEEVSRLPSQDSTRSNSQKIDTSVASSYDQGQSMRVYPILSQMPFQMPASSDATGRSNSPVNPALFTSRVDFSSAHPHQHERGQRHETIDFLSLHGIESQIKWHTFATV